MNNPAEDTKAPIRIFNADTWKSILKDREIPFKQLMVFRAMVVKEWDTSNPIHKFEQWAKDKMGIEIRYVTEFKCRHAKAGGTRRNDVVFTIHEDDKSKFAVERFKFPSLQASWWEDYLENEGDNVPTNIKTKLPNAWKKWRREEEQGRQELAKETGFNE